MKQRFLVLLTILLGVVTILSACGGSNADVGVILIPQAGASVDNADQLQEYLVDKLGETMTTDVAAVPMFDHNKLMVEIAAGDDDIFIVSEDDFRKYAAQGVVSLEEYFDREAYEEGMATSYDSTMKNGEVVRAPIDTKLYGIPMEKSKAFEELGFHAGDMFAFITPRTKNLEGAAKVLKILIEGE